MIRKINESQSTQSTKMRFNCPSCGTRVEMTEGKEVCPSCSTILEAKVSDKGLKLIVESYPAMFGKLNKYAKDKLNRELIKAGFDLQNMPYEEIKVTSSRDPILKDENVVLIFEFEKGELAVTFRDKTIVDCFIGDGYKKFSGVSWKAALDYCTNCYAIRFDEEISARMKAKIKSRKESQVGMIKRQRNPRGSDYDKSGYKRDPDKYKRMLSEMNLQNSERVVREAIDAYEMMVGSYSTVRDLRNQDRKLYQDFRRVMDQFTSTIESFDNAYQEYASIPNGQWRESLKGYVTSYITELRDLTKKAKNCIKRISEV